MLQLVIFQKLFSFQAKREQEINSTAAGAGVQGRRRAKRRNEQIKDEVCRSGSGCMSAGSVTMEVRVTVWSETVQLSLNMAAHGEKILRFRSKERVAEMFGINGLFRKQFCIFKSVRERMLEKSNVSLLLMPTVKNVEQMFTVAH